MSDLNVSSDEARAEEPTHDIERGSDETIKHSAHQVPPDVNISHRSPATVIYGPMYRSLIVTPWFIGNILKLVLPKPNTASSLQSGVPASGVLGALIGIAVGAALGAPFAAGEACLKNLIGSWLMRLHHSHVAYAFHGGSAQGNYAIAGAIAALPEVVMLVTIEACLGPNKYKKSVSWNAFVVLSTFFSSAAVGAAAAAIGAARGFDMQTVEHSTIANVAGLGFIIMVLLPFEAIHRVFRAGLKSVDGAASK
jgi:hypothetical protein